MLVNCLATVVGTRLLLLLVLLLPKFFVEFIPYFLDLDGVRQHASSLGLKLLHGFVVVCLVKVDESVALLPAFVLQTSHEKQSSFLKLC